MTRILDLAELRAKYADLQDSEVVDPAFRAAASAGEFSKDGIHPLPYGGIATFLDAPVAPGPEGVDVALVGVPMDLGVTNRAGARHGPRALREMERIGPYEHVLRRSPFVDAKIADIGDVPLSTRYSLERCHEEIEAYFARIQLSGAIPLAVGGDHSITAAILRAVGRDRPVGMIHIDAHCDTMGSYEGTKFHHGGPFRNAVLDGVLDATRTVQIGIRGTAEFLWEFSYESGMTVIHADTVAERGIGYAIAEAKRVVGDGPVYVSFDVDGLDPAYAPGTGTPEVGGLSTREALALLRGVDGIDFIGGDVVEVAPQYDPTSNTAQAGAQMLFQLLCLATNPENLARRRTLHRS